MNKNQFVTSLMEVFQDAGTMAANDSRYRLVQRDLASAMAHIDSTKAMQMRANTVGSTTTIQGQATGGPSRFSTTPPKAKNVQAFTRKKGVPRVEENDVAQDAENETDEGEENVSTLDQDEAVKLLEAAQNSGAVVTSNDGLLPNLAAQSVDGLMELYNKDQLLGLADVLDVEVKQNWKKAQIAGAVRQYAINATK